MFKSTDAVIEWVDAWVVHERIHHRQSNADYMVAVSAELTRLRVECDARREGAWKAMLHTASRFQKLEDAVLQNADEADTESATLRAQLAAMQGGWCDE